MSDFDTTAGYTIACLVALGGLIGFLKAGSVPSLVAGVGSGAALGYGVSRAARSRNDVYIVVGVSLLLVGMMGKKFMKTGKFMPAGLVTVLSAFTLVRFGIRLL
ncbi:hypothetical protein RQP46_007435 [Phenoliferia psychrophenolica]